MALLGLIKRVSRISRNNSRVRVYPARYFQSRDLSSSNTFHGKDAKLPVLIVGAGPVGLVLSILLTKLGTIYIEKSFLFFVKVEFLSLIELDSHLSCLGVKCALVDKATCFSKHPQAHFINNRSMEVRSLCRFCF